MSLDRIEQEEQDRIQFELQLAGQGGKKCKLGAWDQERRENQKAGTARVQSSENYILTLDQVKR